MTGMEPRRRPPLPERAAIADPGCCGRCQKPATVRTLVTPFSYVCMECLEAAEAEDAPTRK